MINFYHKLISPFFGKRCRFHPSCSVYAIEAIEKHGVFYGSFLAIKRILKCHPFNKKNWNDPVPEKSRKNKADDTYTRILKEKFLTKRVSKKR